MLDNLEISMAKPQSCVEAEAADQSEKAPVEQPFIPLTQDELDIIRWEGEGGQ
jgi:predicted nucleotidyltransferase